jgi:SAM-dependent methyltransferase
VHTGLDARAANRFLAACLALGLIERRGDAFANSSATERHLVPGAAGDLTGFVRRHASGSYPRWRRLAEKLRRWRPGAVRAAPPSEEDQGWRAIRAQHGLALESGRALARVLDLSDRRRLLDVGGGSGAVAIALCEHHPGLAAVVLEREDIADFARTCVVESGLAARIEVRAGDFTRDPLPRDCDAALLANVMSAAGASEQRGLLHRLHDVLPEGTPLILSGWMLDHSGTAPELAVLFCLEDIVRDAPDVERTADTYAAWLDAAGFSPQRRARYFGPASFLVARRRDAPGGAAASDEPNVGAGR